MANMSLLIVTGLSGAGKSMALRRLEDLGYFCVDNLPVGLLTGFLSQCRAAAVSRAALAIDSRESIFGIDWERMLSELSASGIEYRILFLDCRDEVLQRRYAETRRRHPLASGGDISRGIARERDMLQSLREFAHAVIDTSDLKPFDFYARLEDSLTLQPLAQMTLLFMSFGYKRGIPIDADIILDMRFLPNPFYEQALRPLSGLDEPVRSYVCSDARAVPFFDAAEQLLRQMIPGFVAQGKQRLMVAFGCTGGRHRSVAAAEEMARRFSQGPYNVRCFHRDLYAEAEDIRARFSPPGGGV